MEIQDIDPELVEEELIECMKIEDFEIQAFERSFLVWDVRQREPKLVIDADFFNTRWENMVHGLGFLDDQPLSKYLQNYLKTN